MKRRTATNPKLDPDTPPEQEERDLIYVPFNKNIRRVIANKRAQENKSNDSSYIRNSQNYVESNDFPPENNSHIQGNITLEPSPRQYIPRNKIRFINKTQKYDPKKDFLYINYNNYNFPESSIDSNNYPISSSVSYEISNHSINSPYLYFLNSNKHNLKINKRANITYKKKIVSPLSIERASKLTASKEHFRLKTDDFENIQSIKNTNVVSKGPPQKIFKKRSATAYKLDIPFDYSSDENINNESNDRKIINKKISIEQLKKNRNIRAIKIQSFWRGNRIRQLVQYYKDLLKFNQILHGVFNKHIEKNLMNFIAKVSKIKRKKSTLKKPKKSTTKKKLKKVSKFKNLKIQKENFFTYEKDKNSFYYKRCLSLVNTEKKYKELIKKYETLLKNYSMQNEELRDCYEKLAQVNNKHPQIMSYYNSINKQNINNNPISNNLNQLYKYGFRIAKSKESVKKNKKSDDSIYSLEEKQRENSSFDNNDSKVEILNRSYMSIPLKIVHANKIYVGYLNKVNKINKHKDKFRKNSNISIDNDKKKRIRIKKELVVPETQVKEGDKILKVKTDYIRFTDNNKIIKKSVEKISKVNKFNDNKLKENNINKFEIIPKKLKNDGSIKKKGKKYKNTGILPEKQLSFRIKKKESLKKFDDCKVIGNITNINICNMSKRYKLRNKNIKKEKDNKKDLSLVKGLFKIEKIMPKINNKNYFNYFVNNINKYWKKNSKEIYIYNCNKIEILGKKINKEDNLNDEIKKIGNEKISKLKYDYVVTRTISKFNIKSVDRPNLIITKNSILNLKSIKINKNNKNKIDLKNDGKKKLISKNIQKSNKFNIEKLIINKIIKNFLILKRKPNPSIITKIPENNLFINKNISENINKYVINKNSQILNIKPKKKELVIAKIIENFNIKKCNDFSKSNLIINRIINDSIIDNQEEKKVRKLRNKKKELKKINEKGLIIDNSYHKKILLKKEEPVITKVISKFNIIQDYKNDNTLRTKVNDYLNIKNNEKNDLVESKNIDKFNMKNLVITKVINNYFIKNKNTQNIKLEDNVLRITKIISDYNIKNTYSNNFVITKNIDKFNIRPNLIDFVITKAIKSYFIENKYSQVFNIDNDKKTNEQQIKHTYKNDDNSLRVTRIINDFRLNNSKNWNDLIVTKNIDKLNIKQKKPQNNIITKVINDLDIQNFYYLDRFKFENNKLIINKIKNLKILPINLILTENNSLISDSNIDKTKERLMKSLFPIKLKQIIRKYTRAKNFVLLLEKMKTLNRLNPIRRKILSPQNIIQIKIIGLLNNKSIINSNRTDYDIVRIKDFNSKNVLAKEINFFINQE